ncbi:flagellar protein FlgN [Oceanobacillus halophilus]|uniref:Flagellar protein FlgN n=1 Tax=Oceanobacillus halophilus TaxID=930130 RepID=A0A495A762_9BACI|nr:flagellar protein FlgN [Oceanobacillus halophilus]RKQ35579.1 flagellar protein FlgN [Oceanobacillus halophilus]
MSVESIIQSIEKLVSVHEELLIISKEKTKIIKEGSIEKLQALLVKERKQTRLLERAELHRQSEVEKWLIKKGISSENVRISNMLTHVEISNDKEKLASVTTELTEKITMLKLQEELNQALLKQSMQFVQLSMELLNPSIANINYGNQNQDSKPIKQSLFDSQV